MAVKKKAEEQSFLKSRFLASVSHDLRSPLHAIIGGSDILKRQKNRNNAAWKKIFPNWRS